MWFDYLRLARLAGKLDPLAGQRPSALIEAGGVHYVLVEWPMRDLPTGMADGCYWCKVGGEGFSSPPAEPTSYGDMQKGKNLDRLREKLNEAGTSPLVCQLPGRCDSHAGKPLFDAIRARFFGVDAEPERPRAILLGDLPTWFAMNRETEAGSPLGKDIGDQVWVVDGYGEQSPGLQWLTGGDPDLILELTREGDPSGDPQGLRRAVHRIADLLTQDHFPGGLESRLRRTMGAPPAPAPLNHNDGFHRGDLCARLRSFLPGALPGDQEGIAYRLGADRLRRNRAKSVWRGVLDSSTSLTEFGLVAAGLLGFAADEEGGGYYLRLRSPLFAYVAARRALGFGLWRPWDKRLEQALTEPSTNAPRPGKGSGLDIYLDQLLDLALASDDDPEAWLVARLNASLLPGGRNGPDWHDRLAKIGEAL